MYGQGTGHFKEFRVTSHGAMRIFDIRRHADHPQHKNAVLAMQTKGSVIKMSQEEESKAERRFKDPSATCKIAWEHIAWGITIVNRHGSYCFQLKDFASIGLSTGPHFS